MAKRKKVGEVKEERYEKNDNCTCRWFSMKVAAMAFILFLVTVWPAVGNWLVGVPWWVYLIIFVVFGGAGMGKNCWCKKK